MNDNPAIYHWLNVFLLQLLVPGYRLSVRKKTTNIQL